MGYYGSNKIDIISCQQKKDDIIVHNQYRGATTTKNSIEWKKNQTESTIVTH
jgi:hypothetical protein